MANTQQNANQTATVQRKHEPQMDKHFIQSQGVAQKMGERPMNNPFVKGAVPVQRKHRAAIAQLQAMKDTNAVEMPQNAQPIQRVENKTGMPDNLKSGIESLSGMDMSDVKVHYNSDKPAQLQAHAYAQGTDIHLASGQEKHLAHEAWHVVQQKQGRVQATTQMKSIGVNNDSKLEDEADVMGAKALQMKAASSPMNAPSGLSYTGGYSSSAIVQRLQKDAGEYINENDLTEHFKNPDKPTRAEVISFCKENGVNKLSKGLVDAWNTGQKSNFFIGNNDTIEEEEEGGYIYLEAPMSPTHDDYETPTEGFGEGFLEKIDSKEKLWKIKAKKKVKKRAKKKQKEEEKLEGGEAIPTLLSFTEAIRHIREAQNQKDKRKGNKQEIKDWGKGVVKPFFLKLGDFIGLFDRGVQGGGEYIFRPVKEIANGDGYQRDGNTRPWTAICKDLDKLGDMNATKKNILKVLQQGAIPQNEVVFEAAGAMACDAKHSIEGFILYLEDIENSKCTSFSQIFGNKNPVYQPILERQAPKKKRDKHRNEAKKRKAEEEPKVSEESEDSPEEHEMKKVEINRASKKIKREPKKKK